MPPYLHTLIVALQYFHTPSLHANYFHTQKTTLTGRRLQTQKKTVGRNYFDRPINVHGGKG